MTLPELPSTETLAAQLLDVRKDGVGHARSGGRRYDSEEIRELMALASLVAAAKSPGRLGLVETVEKGLKRLEPRRAREAAALRILLSHDPEILVSKVEPPSASGRGNGGVGDRQNQAAQEWRGYSGEWLRKRHPWGSYELRLLGFLADEMLVLANEAMATQTAVQDAPNTSTAPETPDEPAAVANSAPVPKRRMPLSWIVALGLISTGTAWLALVTLGQIK